MLTALRERERFQLGRDPTPSAAIVDSRSVRGSERGGLHGCDGGKKVSGIKRHLLVDTRGTVLVACVSPAIATEPQSCWLALPVLSRAFGTCGRTRATAAPTSTPGPGKPPVHRAGRPVPRQRVPLDPGEGRHTTSGSAPLRGRPATLGRRADVVRHEAPCLYPRLSREELGRSFPGRMTYLDPKGEGDDSMSENQ
ncbi:MULTISPECIES: transposase [unclassified Streptomyces]|uniref:transposase n=1 Tax=unclassified Streptomyces TaxID=2593676 RepID=UPI0037FA1307